MRVQPIALAMFVACAAPATAQAPAAPDFEWCGTDLLVTGSISSDVHIAVSGLDEAAATLHGVWPDIGLYGVFDGELINTLPCEGGRSCLQFDGVLHSLEAAGFPAGTEAPMVVSLDIAADGATARGVYKVGLFPGGYPAEQYGILELGACDVA